MFTQRSRDTITVTWTVRHFLHSTGQTWEIFFEAHCILQSKHQQILKLSRREQKSRTYKPTVNIKAVCDADMNCTMYLSAIT